MKESEEIIAKLKQHAARAAAHCYAPYSRFAVGAAVLSATGQVYGGCNVENLSLIHISEPTRPTRASRMPSSA